MAKKPSLTTPEAPASTGSLMTDRLRLLLTRRAEMWWDIGKLLDEVATMGLAPSLGFQDFTAYAHRVHGIAPSEAKKLRRIAHHFSRETALRFGADRLELLLDYVEASERTHWAFDPLQVQVAVPGRSTTGVPVTFADATDEDLRRAVRAAKRGMSPMDDLTPLDVVAERDRLGEAIAAGVADKHIRVKIHQSTTLTDEYSLAVVGLNPFNMVEVGKALVAEGRALAKATKPAKAKTTKAKTTKKATKRAR